MEVLVPTFCEEPLTAESDAIGFVDGGVEVY
jgi:hypothetical protein